MLWCLLCTSICTHVCVLNFSCLPSLYTHMHSENRAFCCACRRVLVTEQCRQTGLVTLTQVRETVRGRICVHACSAFFKMLTTYQCVSVRGVCMCHSSSQSVISSDGWGWHFIYRTWTSTRTFRSVAVDGFDPVASPRRPVVLKLLFEWLKRKR